MVHILHISHILHRSRIPFSPTALAELQLLPGAANILTKTSRSPPPPLRLFHQIIAENPIQTDCSLQRTSEINDKFDSSYRNSENNITLLGNGLTLGQACVIIVVALYSADITGEEFGILFHIYHFVRIKHIVHILYIMIFLN